jgi:hypothetical protein
MEKLWNAPCRFGIFSHLSFISRLLLWRVAIRPEESWLGEIPEKQRIPSWSWMRRSQIKFIHVTDIKVPPKSVLKFDPEDEGALLVQIRRPTKVTLMYESIDGDIRYNFLDRESRAKVGEMAFDAEDRLRAEGCVIIALKFDGNEDAEKYYWVVFVGPELPNKRYERVGVGIIKARCVTKEYTEGRLI